MAGSFVVGCAPAKPGAPLAMTVVDESLLAKVARSLSLPPSDAPTGSSHSILAAAASSYGAKPDEEEITLPTGFDINAAVLFEAVVEAAFLVANADGDFDENERKAFQSVVLEACKDQIDERQLEALVSDLTELLKEDGLERRIAMVGRTVKKEVHQREILRIAALLAHVSGGVNDIERGVLTRLAQGFQIGDDAVQEAIREAERALFS
ncbi:MAG: tellurite resistance TerB family protein [Myxococcales bacterium]|nr:tellurite resistance TerB family protein [Polyangiaceae bacterium]MDW8247780.1 tellurite resistance TerB family protein [Myxococcales bacterium]